MKLILNIIFSFFVVVSSCSRSKILNNIDMNSLSKDSDSLIRINNWMIIAPFLPDSTFPTLQRIDEDLIQQYGYPENKILNIEDFNLLGRKVSGTDSSKFFKPINISSHILDLEETIDISPYDRLFGYNN